MRAPWLAAALEFAAVWRVDADGAFVGDAPEAWARATGQTEHAANMRSAFGDRAQKDLAALFCRRQSFFRRLRLRSGMDVWIAAVPDADDTWTCGMVHEQQNEAEDDEQVPREETTRVDLSSCIIGGGVTGDLIRGKNWDNTALGPVHTWPQSLLTSVNMMLNSKFPMNIMWGDNYFFFYNDAYLPVIGERHPRALGTPCDEVYSEVDHIIEPQMADTYYRGQANWSQDQLMLLMCNGYLEETYFTWSFSPIYERGKIVGIFTPVVDSTQLVLHERRTKTLRELAALPSGSSTLAECYSMMMAHSMAANSNDVTFALLYRVDSVGKLMLQEAAVVPRDHPAAMPELSLDTSATTVWSALAVQALKERRVVVVDDISSVARDLPGGQWPEPPTKAVVFPILSGTDAVGVVVAGVNPRRALDEPYMAWFELMMRQISSSIAAGIAYEAAQRRVDELAELDRAKTAFFSNISHEFRTPLTLMLGPLEDMLQDNNCSHMKRLELVHRNCVRLLKLVNTLLDFSRFQAGRVDAHFAPVQLDKLTADVASMFRSAIESAGLTFTVDLQPLPQPVYVDQESFEKIVLNLLSNAYKFTLQGGITVALRSSDDANAAVLTVKDTGCGVDMSEMPKLFQRFYRASSSKGRSFEGSGIGLALVADLVRLHGGHVSVDSVLGEGSTFEVTLPLGWQHLPEEQVVRSAASDRGQNVLADAQENGQHANDVMKRAAIADLAQWTTQTAANIKVAPRGSGFTVLVVDDNADLRQYLRDLLIPLYTVLLACDGRDALDVIAKHGAPDLVVADIMMPNMSGLELLQHIRTSERLRTVPVILLSARAGSEASVDGLQNGSDDYLAKPFSRQELLARVQAHLKLGHERLAQLVEQRTSELAASERRYRHLASTCPVGIIEEDSEGHVTYANEHMHAIIDGFDETWRTRIHPDDIQEMLALVSNVGHQKTRSEFRVLRRSGQVVHVMAFCLKDEHSGQRLWAVTDLTDVKRLEADRLEAHRQRAADAEESRRNQELFVDLICHEIRNPLSAVYGIVEQMRSSAQNRQDLLQHVQGEGRTHLQATVDEDLDSLDALETCATHQRMITDDVLNLSRLNAGKFTLSAVDFCLEDVVSDVTRMFAAQIARQNIRFDVNLSALHPRRRLRADRQRITQIMANLLSNAIKFTANRSERQVALRADMVPKDDGRVSVQIAVQDNGVGMTAAEQQKLFHRFAQVGSHETYSNVGSGLGLYICKHRAHGWRHLGHKRKRRGMGTTFAVTLLCGLANSSGESQGPANVTQDRRDMSAQPMSVLVVEDNDVNRRVLCKQLQSVKALEMRVSQAANGAEAVELAAQQHFDVILMDVEMPVMNGIDATAAIRKREHCEQSAPVPIIGVSGNARQKYIDEAIVAGMTGYLVKPYKTDELLNRIMKATKR